MTMNKIDTSGMTQSHLVEASNLPQPHKSRAGVAGTKDLSNQQAALSFSDHAEISDGAHRLVDLKQAVDVGRAALAREPEVRSDRVALARERLAAGFYQSAEVRERVAERISGLVLEGGLF
jgi:hypothetical protein